ncbi:MAG: hypothetical protein QM764_22440 [Chitinophagaceae bacterium]
MNDGQDILKKLRDFEVEPPAALRENIFVELDYDFQIGTKVSHPGLLSQLQELEIAPPSFLYSSVEKRVLENIHLSFLQHLETTPPATAYAAIIEKIAEPIRQQENSAFTGAHKMFRYQAAAVLFLIAVAGFLIYQSLHTAPKSSNGIADKKSIPVNNAVDSMIKTTSLPGNSNNEAIAFTKPKKKKKKPGVAESEQPVELTMSIDDYKFPVVDNDLLFTFSSFTYTALPSFVTDEEKKEFSIRIDQYTAINVSEAMTKMIRRMNLYRNNGKLTNKAKRSRATQEKWKKADADQFDNSLIKNPLDAMDLAEFIFK